VLDRTDGAASVPKSNRDECEEGNREVDRVLEGTSKKEATPKREVAKVEEGIRSPYSAHLV
jgi:hypothetical protein